MKQSLIAFLLGLIALLFTACGVAPRQAPGAPDALTVVTPTPMGAELTVVSAVITPSIHAGIFTAKTEGDGLLIVTATLKNTGNTALQPALIQWSAVDAAGKTAPRFKMADLVFKTAGQTVMPDQPIPAGAAVTGMLVFDVAAYQMPFHLEIRQDENTLISPDFTPVEIRKE